MYIRASTIRSDNAMPCMPCLLVHSCSEADVVKNDFLRTTDVGVNPPGSIAKASTRKMATTEFGGEAVLFVTLFLQSSDSLS